MRLLIAEDDRALGLFLSRGLEADGHRVRLVYDGGAAMDAFRQEMPDLTILDLNMPVKDGEQVLKEFRSLDADVPVLVLGEENRRSFEAGRERGRQEGCQAERDTQAAAQSGAEARRMHQAAELIESLAQERDRYPAVNGVVNTNGALTAINIPLSGQVQQPEATSSFSMTANLNSASPIGTKFPAPITLYDSLGVSYQATINYTKTGTNAWSYNITVPDTVPATQAAGAINYSLASSGGNVATVDPATNLTITGLTSSGNTATITAPTVTPGESLVDYAAALTTALSNAGIAGVTATSTAGGVLSITGANMSTTGSVVQDALASASASGTLNFNASGNLVSPAADVSGISFSGLSDGAANLDMTWNILGPSGTSTISQEDSASALSAAPANGYGTGVYEGFSIGFDGTVTATYTNGQTQAVGQLALANVTNLQGLELEGNGNYATTQSSGAASIGASGTGGLGTIEDSALEESNVNISAEFSDLIVAQRAFEANAKSITTFDTVTQDTINMVH